MVFMSIITKMTTEIPKSFVFTLRQQQIFTLLLGNISGTNVLKRLNCFSTFPQIEINNFSKTWKERCSERNYIYKCFFVSKSLKRSECWMWPFRLLCCHCPVLKRYLMHILFIFQQVYISTTFGSSIILAFRSKNRYQ